MKGYHYPIDESWSTDEIIDVVNFFNLVEQAYEAKVNRENLLLAYERLCEIIPSKSEQKRLFADFQKGSRYSCYAVVKTAQQSAMKNISM